MTLTEALSKGSEVTVIGVVIVFAVLIILMLVMMLMKVVFNRPVGGDEASGNSADSSANSALDAVPTQVVMNDSELIAVLTAAVAASLNTSTYNLKIKSYRRIANTSPDWQKAGLRDVINARF